MSRQRALAMLDIDASILGSLPTPRTRNGSTEATEHHVYALWGLRDTPWLIKPLYTTTDEDADQIRDTVRMRMALAKKLPGFFFCITGETQQNVPVENLEVFWEACRVYGSYDCGGLK